MSHIPNQSREIYKLAVGMFGAAPGRQYFNELNGALEAGMPLTAVYNVLVNSPGFRGDVVELRPDIPNILFVEAFLDRLLGPGTTNVTLAGRDFAESFLLARLDAGESRGQVIKLAIDLLDNVGTGDPNFAAAGRRLDNQISVAQTFTEVQNGSSPDVEFLRQRLALVTSDPASVNTQNDINSSLPGRTFILTTAQDAGTEFTGSSGNDRYISLPQGVNGSLANTLQTTDSLDGAGGVNTLSVTLAQEVLAAPTLKNIQEISVQFTNANAELSLANATGVTKVSIEDSSTQGDVSNVGAVGTLVVRDQNQDVAFGQSTATTLNLTVDSVGSSTALKTIDIGAGEAARATSLALTLGDAHVNLNETNAGTVSAMTIAASGSNTLSLNGAADMLKTLTISSNTGILDLDGVTLSALNILSAEGTTGALKVKVDESAISVKTGQGNDLIEYTGGAVIQASALVQLGAGHDTLIITAAAADGATVDGGDGKDRLTAANASFINADATDIYKSFEILDVSGGSGAFIMSRLPSVTEVLVNGALSGVTTIDAAAADTALTVIATNTDVDVGTAMTFVLKDAAGVNDTLSLNLIGTDDSKDSDADGEITVPSLTANGIEVLDILSQIQSVDAVLTNTAYTHTVVDLASNAVKTLNISGNANLAIDKLTATTVVKIDARAATGDVTVDASGQAQFVLFIGGSANDTYTASAHGDLIETAEGADIVTLDDGLAATDELFFLGGDSQLVAGEIAHDRIFNFGTAAGGGALDIIHLAEFGFTGTLAGVANKGALPAQIVDGTGVPPRGFFTVGGVQSGVAVGTFDSDAGGPLAADTYVFVDVNKNSDFDAATDLFLQLVGVADVAVGNFAFT
jgi:hypothetical protein